MLPARVSERGYVSLESTPEKLGCDHPAMPSVVHGSIAGRFDAIADIFAERIASEDDTGDETYAILQRRSAKVAGVLASLGLTAGGRCAFLAPRGRDSLALMLAVLRLGAVYVPLDPGYPRAQIDFIVADCQPELVIAEAHAFDINRRPLRADYRFGQSDQPSVRLYPGRECGHFIG